MRAAAAVAGAVLVLMAGCADAGGGRDQVEEDPVVATAAVARQDLVTVDEHHGRLGYGEELELVAGRDGTLTALPPPGAIVRRGEVVAEIDGLPTLLLHGARPAWRRLAVSEWASDAGPDVLQLNDNLAALGLAPRDQLPDEGFDWRTRQAVRDWQRVLGLPQTGQLELGDVAFLPGDVRIAARGVRPGMRVHPGDTLALVTGIEQVVTLDLPAAEQAALSEGLSVVVVLPDRTAVDATVRTVGRVASPAPDPTEAPTVEVEIVTAAPSDDAAWLDAAPVVVRVERLLAADALVVPVGALIAPAGGGYAVERVVSGVTELVPVEPGAYADGLVAITGDIGEGDEVVVPV